MPFRQQFIPIFSNDVSDCTLLPGIEATRPGKLNRTQTDFCQLAFPPDVDVRRWVV